MPEPRFDVERERRVLAILDEVLDADQDERERCLDRLTGSDPTLSLEVERLMRIGEAETAFDLRLPAEVFDEGMRTLGTLVGSYRLVRRIRAGGMGVVYEAEQVHPRRRVALKIIRADRLSQPALEQFLAEIRALGRLEHPGIARIYDAGFHAEHSLLGAREVPYLVMEFVRGETDLVTHAHDRGLRIRERLRMFADVCRAVHFGHARGVFHMDLKPDNILVDEEGHPKVIDFGIAQVGGARTTPLGVPLGTCGTLEYMSPERLASADSKPDAGADVYALGVTLYQLVCGSHPFGLTGGETERRKVRAVVDTRDPVPPRKVARVPRDLESVILAAIARDPAQRTPSVLDLLRDVERFLDRRPVSTRPWSPVYVASKLVQRNRRVTAAVCAGLILAGTGGVAFVRSRASEVRAEQEVAQAETVLRLMRAHARTDRLLRHIAGTAAADPSPAAAAAREEIVGEVQAALANHAMAVASCRREVTALEAMHGKEHAAVARARMKLGHKLLVSPFEVAAARAEFQRVRRIFEVAQHEEPDARRLREGLTQCALIEGRVEDAIELHTGGTDGEPPPIPDLLRLGRTAFGSGRFDVAVDLYGRALARARADDPGSLDAAACEQALGGAWWRTGEYARAEPLVRSAHETYRRRLGPDAFKTSNSLNSLGAVLRDAGRLDEAESALQGALAVRRHQAAADNDPYYREVVAASFNNLGWLYVDGGDFGLARDAFADALDQDVPDSFVNSEALVGMGSCLVAMGRARLGQRMLELALEIRQRIYHDRHWLVGDALSALGESLVVQGNRRAGGPHLTDGLAILEESLGAGSRMTVRAARRASLLER